MGNDHSHLGTERLASRIKSQVPEYQFNSFANSGGAKDVDFKISSLHSTGRCPNADPEGSPSVANHAKCEDFTEDYLMKEKKCFQLFVSSDTQQSSPFKGQCDAAKENYKSFLEDDIQNFSNTHYASNNIDQSETTTGICPSWTVSDTHYLGKNFSTLLKQSEKAEASVSIVDENQSYEEIVEKNYPKISKSLLKSLKRLDPPLKSLLPSYTYQPDSLIKTTYSKSTLSNSQYPTENRACNPILSFKGGAVLYQKSHCEVREMDMNFDLIQQNSEQKFPRDRKALVIQPEVSISTINVPAREKWLTQSHGHRTRKRSYRDIFEEINNPSDLSLQSHLPIKSTRVPIGN